MNKTAIRILGFAYIFAYIGTYAITFLFAYFGNKNYTVTIGINTVGEANIELVLLALSFPVLYLFWKDYLDLVLKEGSY
jgi:hypothetical protein